MHVHEQVHYMHATDTTAKNLHSINSFVVLPHKLTCSPRKSPKQKRDAKTVAARNQPRENGGIFPTNGPRVFRMMTTDCLCVEGWLVDTQSLRQLRCRFQDMHENVRGSATHVSTFYDKCQILSKEAGDHTAG